ncbi:plasmodesmata-located protein 1 [Carya illinoinensis]|nr:plasmodesmata-located protein 1 [Carya illinoinensis]
MGLPKTPLSLSFMYLVLSVFVPCVTSAVDYTNLVFKGCAEREFQAPTGNIYPQNLKALLSSLVSQSSQKTFFATTTTTSGEDQNNITGLFQCRGDLTLPECYSCVSKISDTAEKLCGKAIAARIQLNGCYLRYEVVGFKQVSDTEFLYRVCGSTKASETGFEQKRDKALNMVESGVNSSGAGAGGLFYTGRYESVYVLGQCEGDLGSDDCGDCVKSAVERAKAECGDSTSGQVYLQKCYLNYYPYGVPSVTSSSGSGQQHTQRTVALAVGGLAAFGFIIVCFLFVRTVIKKRGHDKHGG